MVEKVETAAATSNGSSENEKEKEETVVEYDQTRILIENVAESCSDETVQLYILLIFNTSLQSDLKIEEIRRNRRRVMVRFNRTVDLASAQIKQKDMAELGGQTVSFHSVKVPDTVRVRDLANNCTKEILNLYFTNVKISQGGEIKEIKYFSFENVALVQFKSVQTVDDVLTKQGAHIICEHAVKLEKYYGPIEDEYIREEEDMSSETYFENTKKDLLETSKQKEKKKSLAALATLKSFSQAPAQIDKTRLIISNIHDNINIQQLEFYIQLLTNKQEIEEINWSLENKGKLLIDFKKEIDIGKVLHEFNNVVAPLNNLNGQPLQLETLSATRTLVVLVKGVVVPTNKFESLGADTSDEYKPEQIPATRDLIDLYFSSKQRSGGGEVESIERKSSRYWLVVMRDQRAVKNILSRKHIVDEKPIKIFPYFENFGLPYLFKPVFDQLTPDSATSAFTVKMKDERLRYFCKVKSSHRKLNEILAESNAVSRYNKLESNILYVSYVEKLKTRVPYTEKIWRLRVKEAIEYFLQIYKYEKLTLSFNQWTTLSKTKQINEGLFNRDMRKVEEDDDEGEDEDGNRYDPSNNIFELNEVLSDNKVKYVGSNCAILSVNETASNVEMHVVGPNVDVERFINKIKDIVCEAFFTFELEEKIIKFKTYLYECEALLGKWLSRPEDSRTSSSGGGGDLTLRSDASDSGSLRLGLETHKTNKLNASRRNTIGQFITKLERDHLDMELSYGKLFQELGYTFLSHMSQEPTEEDDDEYRISNDRYVNTLDHLNVNVNAKEVNESQMDKIKMTLDDLRMRISDMRRKFRQYDITMRRRGQLGESSGDVTEEEDEDEEDVETDEGLFKLFVYAKNLEKLTTFRVHRKCTIGELKEILFEKVADSEHSIDRMVLKFNNVELSNDEFTVTDYAIGEKSNVFLEFF